MDNPCIPGTPGLSFCGSSVFGPPGGVPAPETNPHDRTLRYWTLPQNKLCRLVVAIMGNGGRVNMSKFLLTLCAFGLFFSSALAQEKSLEELDKRSNS
jgi:hypothetical protein